MCTVTGPHRDAIRAVDLIGADGGHCRRSTPSSRGGTVRHGWALLVPLLFAIACGSGGSGGDAACPAPPPASVSPDHGPALTSVTLTVEGLHEGCNDYNGADEERPREDVPVYFTQQDIDMQIGSVTGSGDGYRDSLRFEIPATAEPGPAVLYLGPERQAIATFTVG
jgi:hypothetical protein